MDASAHRKIIHVDMDCFYAAIECRDDPSVADKPVAVAHDSARGVLTTCNYVARKFGCRSAMPVFMARRKCPDLILKPIRFDVYRRESRKIRTIFRDYTVKVEPLSLDEAFLDVSGQKRFAWDIATEIRQRIRRETGLTCSAGVAPNKMLAKIASDWRKPDGQFAVLPDDVDAFMQELPVRRIPGIGPKAELRLRENGVTTCGELQQWPLHRLQTLFGTAWALELHDRCRGRDERDVETQRPRKSLSVERTFERDLHQSDECARALESILAELREDWTGKEKSRVFRSVFVKLKFANFQQATREQRCGRWDEGVFGDLLEQAFGSSPHAIRLIGAGLRFPDGKSEVEDQLELPFRQSDE